MDWQKLKEDMATMISDLFSATSLDENHILVLGVSTSEIVSKKIGTSSSSAAAAALFEPLRHASDVYGFHLAFQCCEHLNRALVVERKTALRFSLDEVSVIPVPKAGGAMAAHAYLHMDDPVVVERIEAHAGIDIGDTFIGMHLRPVVVPIRPSIRQLGGAHVTMAMTRPKLIGGPRAVYTRTEAEESCRG